MRDHEDGKGRERVTKTFEPVRQPSEWQPIASAPKDGTEILAVWGQHGVQIIHWHSWPESKFIKAGGMWVPHGKVPINADPVLWTPIPPLPDPPKGGRDENKM